ncbi:hypothetical protein AAW14_16625 [Streptomyces hygroscopicus]|nr:hypothetical protein [Streptomyces hygroscopicus]
MQTVTGQWKALLLCTGPVLVFNVTDYLLLSYMPSRPAGELKCDETHGLLVVLGVMALMMIVQPFAGALSDRIGRRPVIAAACAGLPFLSVPAVPLIRRGSLLAARSAWAPSVCCSSDSRRRCRRRSRPSSGRAPPPDRLNSAHTAPCPGYIL